MRVLACMILIGLAACQQLDCGSVPLDLSITSSDMSVYEYADSDSYQLQAYPTAVGGTQRYSAVGDNDCENTIPVAPVVVRSQNPEIATVTTDDTVIDVRGIVAGTAMIGVQGEGVSTVQPVRVASIDRVALAAKELGEPGAFYVDTPVATIILLDDVGEPVVDRDLSVTGAIARADKWNELAVMGTAPGDYALTIHAGGADWPASMRVVDHITDIAARDATLTVPATSVAEVCFFAHLDGVIVAGVPWQLDYDKGSGIQYRKNCAEMAVGNDHKLVQTVTAHALGFTATTVVTFTP